MLQIVGLAHTNVAKAADFEETQKECPGMFFLYIRHGYGLGHGYAHETDILLLNSSIFFFRDSGLGPFLDTDFNMAGCSRHLCASQKVDDPPVKVSTQNSHCYGLV